jgi:tRNA-specific 2-thiouridylase
MDEKMNGKAMIAMSGGVDSSVAAYLMKARGCDCVGVTMKLFSNEDIGVEDSACCSVKDTDDARGVAWRLGIPHYVFNFSGDFEREVIRRFVAAYGRGDTPNPCVDCNRYIKFERLFSRARLLEYDFIVTGHYARIEWDGEKGRFSLKKALDGAKDQSYFLYALTQEQMAHTLFPLGGLRKAEVREIARAQGFLNAQKRESQDICFVPEGGYADFIERYTGERGEPGDFIDASGKVLGRHRGQIRYTVGQRKGLGIAFGSEKGERSKRGERLPLYVCGKNPADNTVTLGGEEALYSRALLAGEFNWVAPPPPPETPLRVAARTRYRQDERGATAERLGDGTVRVEFDEPQRAVATGQAVVLYDGDDLVGGGTIIRVL